jgi:hypothetical protein
MKNRFNIGLAALLLGTMACEPVFAIGWKELIFVFVLAGFVFGPPLYRFLRKLERSRKSKEH